MFTSHKYFQIIAPKRLLEMKKLKRNSHLVSSFGTHEDAMLSLPMACYYHRLKLVALFKMTNSNGRNFIRNRLLHPFSKEEEEPDFDHIGLCYPDQSKLASCFGDDQCIVCEMKRDETAHELSCNIIEVMFHKFIKGIGIISMFILLLVNKSARDHLRIGNCTGTTMDIMQHITV